MAVEAPGTATLEDAAYLPIGFALGSTLFSVCAGFGVVDHAHHCDDVQGAVEVPVAAAVEPVSAGVA